MGKRDSVYDRLDSVLSPFVSWMGVPTPEDNIAAKEALIAALDIIKSNPPSQHGVGWGPMLIHLDGLQRIFFPLLNGNFPDACDKLSDYIYCDWRGDSHDGLVLLLEEVKAGKFEAA